MMAGVWYVHSGGRDPHIAEPEPHAKPAIWQTAGIDHFTIVRPTDVDIGIGRRRSIALGCRRALGTGRRGIWLCRRCLGMCRRAEHGHYRESAGHYAPCQTPASPWARSDSYARHAMLSPFVRAR